MSEYEVVTLLSYKDKQFPEINVVNRINREPLDPLKISQLLIKIREKSIKTQLQTDDELLTNLGVLYDGKPTIAGILTLGKYPQALSPSLVLSCAVAATNSYGESDDRGVRFVAEAKFTGTITEMIEQGVAFVSSNINKSIKIDVNGVRETIWDYPLQAIREAIVNSLIHRDYSVYKLSIPVSLVIYRDRIVIENPGSLFGCNTIENLGTPGRVDIRNPFITNIVETLDGTENMNSGIIAMRQYMKAAGKNPPLFENLQEAFRVTFFKNSNNGSIDDESIIEFCKKPRSKSVLSEHFGFNKDRASYFYKVYVEKLIDNGRLKLTLPNKPKSKNQRIVANVDKI